jgi:hypothetical protein
MPYLQQQPHAAPSANTAGSVSAQRTLLRLVSRAFGTIGHMQISSPEFNRKIHAHFHKEIAELKNFGFRYLASDGEYFSLFRVIFFFPALAVIGTWSDGVPITLYKGTNFLAGYPVLASADGATYANPNDMGVKFFTSFDDGSLLASGTYDDPTARSPKIIRQFRKAGIADTWTWHQTRAQALESEGKRIDRNPTYQGYVRISDFETAPW